MTTEPSLPLQIRDLEPADLADLDWSGGPEHLRRLAESLGAAATGQVALLVGALPNARLIALGEVDFRIEAGVGTIGMLAVHETLQSLGVGTRLIAALEHRAAASGCHRVRLTVEQDNPRGGESVRPARLCRTGAGPAAVADRCGAHLRGRLHRART